MQREDFRLLSLKLENFRCYNDLEIKFDANIPAETIKEDGGVTGGISVLVAKNGEGKTAILDAINIAWGTFIGKLPKTRGAGFRHDDVRVIVNSAGQKVEPGRPSVRAVFQINDEQVVIARQLTDSEKKPTTTIKDARGLITYAERVLKFCNEKIVSTTLPIIAYYGDNRLWDAYGRTKDKAKVRLNQSRKYAYSNSTDPKSGYKEFLAWYKHLQMVMAYAEIQLNAPDEKKPVVLAEAQREYEKCKYYNDVLTNIIEIILGEHGWNRLCYRFSEEIIYIQNVYKDEVLAELPVESLSAGIKTILGVVADLAYRCCNLNSMPGYNSNEITPGIVLIDEIDLHLHPSWQQVILRDLRRAFPRIQFIVTTHSPHVVSSVTSNCVRIIADGQAEYCDSQTQGVPVNDILSGIFGTFPFPQHLPSTKKIDRLNALIATGMDKSEEFNGICDELTAQYGADYGPLLDVLCFAELQQCLNAKPN